MQRHRPPLFFIVAVSSTNQSKNKAVAAAFERAFTDASVETHGFSTESGVSNQPTTDEASIEGAINRAHAALAQRATAQYGVGLEGNTVTIAGRMYLHGWRNTSFRSYADYMQTDEFSEGMKALLSLAKDKPTAIMCTEAVPWRRHRSMIGDALIVRDWQVIDIFDAKKRKPKSSPVLQ